MLETLKSFLSLLFLYCYGPFTCMILFTLFFVNWHYAIIWVAVQLAPLIYTLELREKRRVAAMIGDVQVTSERQRKAIDEYLALVLKQKPNKRSLLDSILRRGKKENATKPVELE